MKLFKLITLLSFLLFSCYKKKEEIPNLKSGFVRVLEYQFDFTTYFYPNQVIGAEVTTYRTEADFWLEQNPVHKGYTNEHGYFYLYEKVPKHDENTYWVKVKYQKLNNYRNILELKKTNNTTNTSEYIWPRFRNEYLYEFETGISPTPTKLKIKVLHNGNLVNDAQVDIYLSKEDYLNFKNFDMDGWPSPDADMICNNNFINMFIRNNSGSIIKTAYRGLTDANGIASICSLEPRKYWIRVRKDGKNNDNTIFETDTLPDDVNVQNYLEIGIQ